jgi:hypothetical protein
LTLKIGAASNPVILAGKPVSIDDAAGQLQTAIRAASPSPAYSGAFVVALGTQLLIVPGTNQQIAVGPVTGVDTTTVAELQLNAQYFVRVRVNGAESIDLLTVTLP